MAHTTATWKMKYGGPKTDVGRQITKRRTFSLQQIGTRCTGLWCTTPRHGSLRKRTEPSQSFDGD